MPYDFNNADIGRTVATTKAAGITQFATDAQVTAGSRADRALSSANVATNAEAQAQTAGKLLTAANLGAEGFLQYADVTLTNAQIKAVRATPVTLVAAQGAGTVIKFMGALLKLNYGGNNAFTESADNLAIKYTDGSGVAVSGTIESTAFITATADTYSNAEPAAGAIVAATGAENQALVIHNTGDGEIAGNAADDNTLSVRVYYTVQSI